MLLPFQVWGQTRLHVGNGGVLSVRNGEQVYVTGNVGIATGGELLLQGSLYLADTLSNDGRLSHNTEDEVAVRFTGAGNLLYKAAGHDTVGYLVLESPATASLHVQDTLSVFSSLDAPEAMIYTNGSASDLLIFDRTIPVSPSIDLGANGWVVGPVAINVDNTSLVLPVGTATEAKKINFGSIVADAGTFVQAEALATPPLNNPGPGVGLVFPDHHWRISAFGGTYNDAGDIELKFSSGISPAQIPSTHIVYSPDGVQPYGSMGNDFYQNGSPPYYIGVNNAFNPIQLGYYAFGACASPAGTAAVISASSICEVDTIRLEATGYDPTADLQWILSADGGSTWADVPGQTSDVFYSPGIIPGQPTPTHFALRTISNTGCLGDTSSSVLVTVNESVRLDIKVYLEGAYRTVEGDMSDTLNKISTTSYSSLLDSMYSETSPVALYNGQPVPKMYRDVAVPAGAVDVIKVELWPNPPTAKLDTCYAWVMSDGSVQPFFSGNAGGNHLMFCGVGAGSYNVVVRHRNHISIITASAHTLSTTPVSLDLSVLGNVANNNLVFVNPGAYAMIGGNVYDNLIFNDEDEVNSADFFRQRVANNLLAGDQIYQQIDVRFDGYSNSSDMTITSFNSRQLRISNAPKN
ncbi:MAG: hypothetical protein KF690_01500 [Bacteroidetes bacterium]|nr:hypothetical protein [Bacteroidota bacterium]